MNVNPLIPQTSAYKIITVWSRKFQSWQVCYEHITGDWPDILWQHRILQLDISSHEYGNFSWVQLNVYCWSVWPYRSNAMNCEIQGIKHAAILWRLFISITCDSKL